MIRFFFGILTFFFAIQNLNAVQLIPLKGYLGSETFKKANSLLEEAAVGDKKVVLEINSTSGDIFQALDFAKQIYEQKMVNHLDVSVYLNENAIGPSAIFPFLAETIETSFLVNWGDIPGEENQIPTNLLRNQVQGFIAPSNSKAATLSLLADAMTDPAVRIIRENGNWRAVAKGEKNGREISTAGQTLVINQHQMEQLGLIDQVVRYSQFLDRFKTAIPDDSIEKEEEPAQDELGEKLKKHIKYNPEGSNKIGYITIDDRDGTINQSTWLYVNQALEYYKKNPPIFIIVRLNTPGGEVFAAQKISDALQKIDIQHNIPVVAFIDNWAISAGAMVAYSSRFISAVKDASMGAAEPVIQGEKGQLEAASEKVNSAIRADFANRARFFDRNPLIAEAMVDKDLLLVLRRGEIVKLDNEEQIRRRGRDPDIVISPKGKLLTLNSEEMLKYGVADFILDPEKLVPITEKEKEKGSWPASKMLLLQHPFLKEIPEASIDYYQMDWKTRFFVFLATPMVSSLLFLGMIMGGYIEINTPGFGIPGIIAGICFFLILLSSFSLQIANWLELIFLIAGLLFILIEIFIVPTGILGLFGAALFLIGFFGLMLPGLDSISFDFDTNTLNAAGEYFLHRLAWLSGTLILAVILIALLARYVLPSFKGFQRFVLAGNEQVASQGYVSADTLPDRGTTGIVEAPLRPSGKVVIGDKIYDAISQEGYIDRGKKVKIVEWEGGQIVVTEVPEEEI